MRVKTSPPRNSITIDSIQSIHSFPPPTPRPPASPHRHTDTHIPLHRVNSYSSRFLQQCRLKRDWNWIGNLDKSISIPISIPGCYGEEEINSTSKAIVRMKRRDWKYHVESSIPVKQFIMPAWSARFITITSTIEQLMAAINSNSNEMRIGFLFLFFLFKC